MWFFHRTTSLAESTLFQGMIDCHSHLLPGVDDGVQTLEESLQILHQMEQLGVRRVWLTPHVMEDIPNETLSLQQHFQTLKESYQGTVEIRLAAEYMLDNLFEERLENNDLLPLEEGKRYLLVETSYFNPPVNLFDIFDRIKAKGYYPVLAHPERYVYMTEEEYRLLKGKNIKFQLNLFSLAGAYGKSAKAKAEWLLKNRFYDLTGTDTHRLSVFKYMKENRLTSEVISTINQIKDKQLV